jgi:predicted esterase
MNINTILKTGLLTASIISAISLAPQTIFAEQTSCESASVQYEGKFVKKPQADKPILLVFFHGLGRDFTETQKWADKNFARTDKNGKEIVKTVVLDYEAAGLSEFNAKIQAVLDDINKQKHNSHKADIVAQKEMELLPILRKIFIDNINKIQAQFGDIPMENIVLVGHSLGGLLASTFIEVLGNNQLDQVQSILTSMSPPVGFVNCKFNHNINDSTTLPWIIHNEMGTKDPIFVNGAEQMKRCCQVFAKLNHEGQSHITCSTHDGEHIATEKFKKNIKEAIDIALARQNDEEQIFKSLTTE